MYLNHSPFLYFEIGGVIACLAIEFIMIAATVFFGVMFFLRLWSLVSRSPKAQEAMLYLMAGILIGYTAYLFWHAYLWAWMHTGSYAIKYYIDNRWLPIK